VTGPELGEALGVPAVTVLTVPILILTGAFALPLLPDDGLGPLHRLSHAPVVLT
jgi:hypothetical protein